MGHHLVVSVAVCAVVVMLIIWAWRMFCWLWWKPMKLERELKQQGIRGPSYRLFYGNLQEEVCMMKEAQSKPISLSHNIGPRVLPFMQQTIMNYGKTYLSWFGTTPTVNIMNPDHVRDILSNKSGHFAKPESNPLISLLASGLLNYEGEKWVKHRRIINPAFHAEKLKRMLPAFETSCSELVNKWKKLVASEGSYEVEVWSELEYLTGDVISRTAFGSSYEEGKRIFQLQKELGKHVMQVAEFLYIPGFRFLPTKRNNRMKEIDREVRAILRNMINEREKAIKIGKANKDDLLGLLMESNIKEIQEHEKSKKAGMSVNEIIEECKLFYFAGQETTSSLLTWTMVVLSMHSDWQMLAREEVMQIFGNRKPDFEGLSHLKIVTMILNEVLRLYPPVPLFGRRTYKTMKLGELTLPAGVLVLLPTLLIQHDHELWGEDANEFNPERFSEGISKATKNQLSFFPFSWGPRICIGQNFAMIEAKMALTMILQHFSFELSATYAHAPYSSTTLQPQYGVQVILHKL